MNSHVITGFFKRAAGSGIKKDEALNLFYKLSNFIPTVSNNTPVLSQPIQLGKLDAQPKPMVAPNNQMQPVAPKPATNISKPLKLSN